MSGHLDERRKNQLFVYLNSGQTEAPKLHSLISQIKCSATLLFIDACAACWCVRNRVLRARWVHIEKSPLTGCHCLKLAGNRNGLTVMDSKMIQQPFLGRADVHYKNTCVDQKWQQSTRSVEAPYGIRITRKLNKVSDRMGTSAVFTRESRLNIVRAQIATVSTPKVLIVGGCQ